MRCRIKVFLTRTDVNHLCQQFLLRAKTDNYLKVTTPLKKYSLYITQGLDRALF